MSGRHPLKRRRTEAPGSGGEQVPVERRAQPQETTIMSEFVYLFRIGAEEQREAMGTPERAQQSMRVWLAWMRDLESKGHIKNPGQPLDPRGKVVRGSQRTITDGPYIEVKDLVAGFIIIEARDLAQAVELSTGCPMLDGGGSVEVRPVMGSPR
jgi:hypothetical protein